MNQHQIDPTQKAYVLWIQDSAYFEIHGTIVRIAKLLLNDEFVFCSASADGGISEIGHLGVDEYRVKYTDFSAFENNFFIDHTNAQHEASKNSGGWISSLDYRDLSIFLKKGAARLWVMTSTINRILIRAYDFDGSFDAESVVEKIIRLLATPVKTENLPCYTATNISEDLRKHNAAFLTNWTNEPLDQI